jgi:hypothetical protein
VLRPAPDDEGGEAQVEHAKKEGECGDTIAQELAVLRLHTPDGRFRDLLRARGVVMTASIANYYFNYCITANEVIANMKFET